MVFQSPTFVIFLAAVFLLYRVSPQRWRWVLLLVSSYAFYASLGSPHLLAALVLVTCVSFLAGRSMGRTEDPGRRRLLFWTCIGIDLLPLVGLKYLGFLSESLRDAAGLAGWQFTWKPLGGWATIGLSYYVLQAISYLVDVYLEVQEPATHLGRFALYLAFFPKLLQGPIERAGNLLPQLEDEVPFDYEEVRYGLALFSWGLFKKMVIADRMGLFADGVFRDVHVYTGLPLILGTYFYAFQIFLDFSAYTDMALGCARIFGIRLTPNFNSPYLATSIADFWRRWHISFSRWIFDYLFKPLQFHWRDGGAWGATAAILVTFLVSGLWHGANWTFIAWGLLHGVYLAAGTLYKPFQKRIHSRLGIAKNSPWLRGWQVFVTFHMVCLAWIFFRAASIREAIYVVTHLFRFEPASHGLGAWLPRNTLASLGAHELLLGLLLLAGMATLSLLAHHRKRFSLRRLLDESSTPARWAIYYLVALSIMAFALFGNGAFIYYQF